MINFRNIKVIAVCTTAFSFSQLSLAQTDLDLQDEDNRIAYSIGVNIGQSLMAQGLMDEVNFEVFAAGLRDQVTGESRLTMEEMGTAIQAFQQRMMDRETAILEESRQASDAFLAANATRQGVVTLPSGLQYQIMESGAASGVSPVATDSVLAHYHGTFVDGSIFDSSVDRGEPAQFGVSQVIAGWTEALQIMKPGDKWRLFIPANLAYGEAGSPPVIPPNSALIFDVELIEVR
ncbi:MAG: FKBP-type peptidyl-prolyl cis-trans isomerase [Pseudohongiellaceae bacterium]